MEQTDFNAPLINALEGIRLYVNQLVAYNKLLLSKKMTELSARLVLFLLIFGISGLVLLFLSFAFANWYAFNYGELYVGYLILVGFYFLLATIIFVFRQALIFTPIRRITGAILFSDDEDSEDLVTAFNSVASLNNELKKAVDNLSQEEEDLKLKFEELNGLYTLPNIVQHFARNAFQSILTTSNVARVTYFIAQKLKGKKKPDQLK